MKTPEAVEPATKRESSTKYTKKQEKHVSICRTVSTRHSRILLFRASASHTRKGSFPVVPKLLVATKNAHKSAEIRAILGSGWEVTDLNAFPEIPAPEETGETFTENAAIKALAASAKFAGLVLSDDSGLEVDALDGAPGVRSARYAGENAPDADNRAKLLLALAEKEVRGKARTARFRCVMAVARDGQVLGHFHGTVEGVIIPRERGEGGFGYDPLFIPDGYCETFGELPAEVKNQLSHRARALEETRKFLEQLDVAKPNK